MKRVGYITDKDGRHITLLEAMGDYGNVQKAYNKARKCKRHRKDVLIFTKDKEENLDKVREDILNLAYEPSEYHYFKVYEPKERQIMALPFYDRVVQHAINNVLEPIFDKAVYTAAGQQASAGVPFSVQVDILDLNIRTGAGTNYAKTGETTGKGVFTIVEVKAGQGASAGWGRLKSGAGWISLDYATRLA